MNSHIAGVVKAQALVRGVLQRLRLKRDPRYKRLFRPQPELQPQGRYDRGSMWDLEKGDLVEYSERRYSKRKKQTEAVQAQTTPIVRNTPITESRPVDQEALDLPDRSEVEAANPPIDLPTPQSDWQEETTQGLVYTRVEVSPEPDTSPQAYFPVWKLPRTASSGSSGPEQSLFPPPEVREVETLPLPSQSEAVAELPQLSDSQVPLPEDSLEPYKSATGTESLSQEPATPSHFHRRANSYRSYHESSAPLPPPVLPFQVTEKAESPVSAQANKGLFSLCRAERLDIALQAEIEPGRTDFPIAKPETPEPGEGRPSVRFGEVARLGRTEAEWVEIVPVATEFPLVKPETPALFPQQPSLSFQAIQFLPLNTDLQGELAPEPTYFPISKPETPVAAQSAPSQSFQASPSRLQSLEREESVPVQTAFPKAPRAVMKSETPVIKPETPVSSQPAPSHAFPSIAPISRAATPTLPEVPPVPSSTRPKSPATSLFFQTRPAPLQPSTVHHSHLDTPSDRTPSFPPSLHNSSRRGEDSSLVPGNTTLVGSLSASFQSFGQGSGEKRPQHPPLIMQGADYRASNGKIRSKSHTREWSVPQPDAFKSSLPAKSLPRDLVPDPRSLSRGRGHRTKTPDQRLLRLISPYDPSWNKRVLERVFRIGVEVRLRPNAYLPDLIIRRLRRNGTRDLQPARMRELEAMELL